MTPFQKYSIKLKYFFKGGHYLLFFLGL
jgi:hypothetical protein